MNSINSIQKVNWQGASGRLYTYLVYRLPAGLDSTQNGNFIFTTVVNGRWVPLHIGEGNLANETNLSRQTLSIWLIDMGATHVHAHINSDHDERIAEAQDLNEAFPELSKRR